MIETMNEYVTLIFMPFDVLFSIIFCFTPATLRMFSVSMLTVTLGAILSLSGKNTHLVIKYIMYLFFLCYSLYSLGIFIEMNEVNLLDWTGIAFSIIAPICMLIVGKKVLATRVKGKYKLFNLYILWLLYILVSILYALLYPLISLSALRFAIIWFTLLYAGFSMAILAFCNYISGGA